MIRLLLLLAVASMSSNAMATTCAGATVISAIPYSASITCGGTNNITSANSATCGNPLYLGGNEAVLAYTPSVNQPGMTVSYNGVSWTAIFIYQGCPTSGGACLQSVASSATSKSVTYNGGLTAGVTYYIVIDTYPTPNSPCPGTVSISLPVPAATNTTCANQTPICSGSPITFTANTGGSPASTVNPGNNYGCLLTSPNPSWYYLKIANPGTLTVDITAGSDVDYAAWGPYANLSAAQAACNSYPAPVSCSYSTSATEQLNITGVTTGQVYVLLVTNYANTVQTITVNNAGGSATTDCSIVTLPVGMSVWDLYVSGSDVILNWTTESEQNNSHFVVERSADTKVWETIGLKQGFGSTQEAHNYIFRDEKAIAGVSYYRLRQVDLNGSATFSPILSANTMEANLLKVYPNPASGSFNVIVNAADVSETYITDVSGKIYRPETSDGGNTLKVDTSGLKKGLYQLVMIVNGERIVTSVALN